jgi:hypothetical protein
MLRELINKLSRSVSEQMVPSRRPYAAPLKVWFDPDVQSERAMDAARAACIMGETVDMSSSGIGFNVPFIRLKEKYLVNQDRVLNVEIDLPGGRVFMRVLGRRYEKVGMHSSVERFVVGASIESISEADKDLFETFLRTGEPRRVATTAERVGMATK